MMVVIADDLTGAAELAGVARLQGLSAEVQTVFDPDSPAEVVCVDTDTRLLPPEQAARQVAVIASRVAAAQPEWIFKKCDSVLRGAVLAEARATAGATGKKRLLVLPANPSRQRLIRDGRYFIAGQPLDETDFARDPAHPRTTALVSALLGGDLTGVASPDAGTPAELASQAAAMDRDTLPVGAVDFFTALLQIRHPPRSLLAIPAATPAGPTLLVCGSASSWTQRRAQATARRLPVFARPYDSAGAASALQSGPGVLIGIGEVDGGSPAILSAELATVVADLVRRGGPIARLLLEGGATARSVVDRLGWKRLQSCQNAAPGVGVLQPVGGPGPLLFIKPGSYPWPMEIWPGLPPA